jgi:RNA polymerase sigma factor (sigma-70 family)
LVKPYDVFATAANVGAPSGTQGQEATPASGVIYAHRSSLYGFVLRRTRDATLAEDIVQETFAKLLTAQSTTTIHNLAAFSYRIAENLVRDHYRRAGRQQSEGVSETLACLSPTAEQVVMSRQRLEQFQTIIAKMPPLRRDVFLRRRLHGQSHSDIAAELGISVASVEKHIVRAVVWLSERMDSPQNGGTRL